MTQTERKTVLRQLTTEEITIILVALRNWQERGDSEHFTDYFDEVEEMGDDAIDNLCESLNCSEVFIRE